MPSRNTPQYWETLPPTWNDDNSNVLVCCQIRQETHDVKSFSFKPLTAGLFRFLPGQFMTLELCIEGKTVHRSYTIASSPARPDTITLTVKRTQGGVVSNWLHDHLEVNQQIMATGPMGDFTCSLHPADKYLFLSGGSGITPLMSMTRSFHDLGEDPDIAFLHNARTSADIIFRKELDLIAFNQRGFRPTFICETTDVEPGISTGRLTLELLQQRVPDFLQREIFTCGPALYMKNVRMILATAGFDMQHYHEESFSFEVPPTEKKPEENASSQTGGGFSIHLTQSNKTIRCAPDQRILDAALAAGLRLPSACSKGVCGTCKSKMTSGRVDMQHSGGIRPREIEQDMILLCCSKPLSDVTIAR